MAVASRGRLSLFKRHLLACLLSNYETNPTDAPKIIGLWFFETKRETDWRQLVKSWDVKSENWLNPYFDNSILIGKRSNSYVQTKNQMTRTNLRERHFVTSGNFSFYQSTKLKPVFSLFWPSIQSQYKTKFDFERAARRYNDSILQKK